jgi:hypothetical protein
MDQLTRWLLGISLALLNCFLSSLGLTLQRLSTLREADHQQHNSLLAATPKRSCKSLWLLGVSFYVAAAVPDVLSYVLIPQVICSAVACFRLVVVTVMACIVLGEKLSAQHTLGMGLCSVGTFLCLYFGPVKMEKALITSQMHSSKVAIYLITGGIILVLASAFDHLDAFSGKCHMSARCRSCILPFVTGLAFAISKVFNTEIGFIPLPSNLLLDSQWITCALGIALLGLADLYFNLRATRLMEVQVFVPVSFVCGVSLQYFQSVLLFEEFASLNQAHVMLASGGACISLIGALCIQVPRLSCHRSPPMKPCGVDGHASRSISGVDLEHCRGKARLFLES